MSRRNSVNRGSVRPSLGAQARKSKPVKVGPVRSSLRNRAKTPKSISNRLAVTGPAANSTKQDKKTKRSQISHLKALNASLAALQRERFTTLLV
jgi:hypothetical protein